MCVIAIRDWYRHTDIGHPPPPLVAWRNVIYRRSTSGRSSRSTYRKSAIRWHEAYQRNTYLDVDEVLVHDLCGEFVLKAFVRKHMAP